MTPSPMPHRLAGARVLAGVLLCVCTQAAVVSTECSLERRPPPTSVQQDLLDAATWAEWLLRDERLGFDLDIAQGALADLQSPRSTPRERAAALVALGASGSISKRATLVLYADEGEPLERVAAILAMGELRELLGPADVTLVDFLQHEDGFTAECALLALLRTGRPGWRDLAAGISVSPEHRLFRTAGALLAFVADQAAAPPSRSAARLLELRFEAAKKYGTVDGRAWVVSLLDELKNDDQVLDELVLITASDMDQPGVRDHLLQLLMKPGSPLRVRASVRAMPIVVDQLIETGLWVPANAAEWSALLDEAVTVGVAEVMPNAIARAVFLPALAPTAAAVLAPTKPRMARVVLDAMGDYNEALRLRAVLAAGDSGMRSFVPHLVSLEDDPAPPVQVAAWVSRLRLGDPSGATHVRDALLAPSGFKGIDHDLVLDSLARGARAGIPDSTLFSLSRELEGVPRADVLAMLALRGRPIDGAILREHYLLADPHSATAHRLLEALGELPSRADLAFLAELFPREGDRATNLVLAHALLRHGHSKVEPVLKVAVWTGPLERSLLAAIVVKHTSGLLVLLHWVLKPPSDATSDDIRRLGFAIG